MRIIAIGIGGAGCRIVNSLYAIDRKSSKVACVQALAVDVDEEAMKQLTALPENQRMCYSAFEPEFPNSPDSERQAAPIDINEIVIRIQNLESAENDAIMICCGLGGSMVDVAPHIIAGLRSSVVEPIFGLVTLPCLSEGKRISGKAANDIEMLSSLLDGIIVFDNETWHKKIKTQNAHLQKKEMGFAEKLGLIKSEKPLSPAHASYKNLNEVIVRRIGLMLRAGEFRADGGIDLAEVVLDSGEVLNTMKGMGFITIGYAVEKLPHDPLRFLSWLKPGGLSDEEQKKKASRIVELAKQAIYHEISTPCDLTSAHKALVLIAGPSQELSMKGFMTVRKWIDRSIAGLETRSGDYPIMNTKNVAIIVMLSGLENIPRITELMEIRSQSKTKEQAGPEVSSERKPEKDTTTIRDDMITLPVRRARAEDTVQKAPARDAPEEFVPPAPAMEPAPQNETPVIAEVRTPSAVPELPKPAPQRRPVVAEPVPVPENTPVEIPEVQTPSRRRVIVSHAETDHARHPSSRLRSATGSQQTGIRTGSPDRLFTAAQPTVPRPDDGAVSPKETERQRIERELRRQRSMAIGGQSQKSPPQSNKNHPAVPDTHVIKRGAQKADTGIGTKATVPQGNESAGVSGEKRTIIIGKRKVPGILPEEQEPSAAVEKTGDVGSADPLPEGEMNVEIRDRIFRARDGVFEGKGVRKPVVPQARDSTLLHTDIRSKRKVHGHEDPTQEDTGGKRDDADPVPVKKRARDE